MNTISFGRRKLGDGQPAYIILEAGSNWLDLNHAGDMDYGLAQAKELISVAKNAGADAIKFQMFRARDHISSKAETPDILKETYKKTLFDIIEELELPRDWIKTLDSTAAECDIDFLMSPCDKAAVTQLLEETNPPGFKLASFDIVDLDFVRFLAATQKPLILSTGMASLEEMQEALEVCKSEGNENICFLHCISSYPAPIDQVCLRTIETMKHDLGTPVGFSDHTLETVTASIAVAAGASCIEKHFTLDRKQAGPDHSFALEPDEAKEMIAQIRKAESMLGEPLLGVRECEKPFRDTVRRSIVVGENGIRSGETFCKEHFVFKRGAGILPRDLSKVLGQVAKRGFEADDILKWEDL